MSNLLYIQKSNNQLIEINPNEVMDKLYFQEIRGPLPAELPSDIKDKELFIQKQKDIISTIHEKIPLYDERKRNLYLIVKENVYNRVVVLNYRFPDPHLLEEINRRKLKYQSENLEEITTNKNTDNIDSNIDNLGEYNTFYNQSRQNEYSKLLLMLDFLNESNMELLYTTYITVFYKYNNEIGKNITTRIRPSFLHHYLHINPYYSRTELINLALNFGLIDPDNTIYDDDNLNLLCKKVSINDISSKTIIDHQKYIANQNKIGVIQYYSIHGSYPMNRYLRNMVKYEYKNELLESIIKSMWELIKTAPAFDKEYTLYRFIHDDSYLKHLNIGDVYMEPSFISTTRDPFYKSDIYRFGFILIKIKIPNNTPGVALCIESYSHFAKEEEIIFAPRSKLRLDKVDKDAVYYHTDNNYASKINRRYEFTYIESAPIELVPRIPLKDNTVIDFLKISGIQSITLIEKLNYFISHYVNDIYQFSTIIGQKNYTIMFDNYDSTNVYRDFYAETTKNGFLMYTFAESYIQFMIELSEDDGYFNMDVNYYFKTASTDINQLIPDIDFIDFLAKIGYYFAIDRITIYCHYVSCDIETKNKSIGINNNNNNNKNGESTINSVFSSNAVDNKFLYGGNYNLDHYNYLKYGRRRFQNDDINIKTFELKSMFNYYELDKLKTISIKDVVNKNDRDEIYQIYKNIYINNPNNKDNIADFYIR